MREMIYTNQRTIPEILDSGNINGYEYRIISYGTHPCVYIALPKTHKLYSSYRNLYRNPILKVHGNITYTNNILLIGKTRQRNHWIGWDYSSYGDYTGNNNDETKKKWKVSEILNETQFVIKQLEKCDKRKEISNEKCV